jgi:hypothetical protein
MTGGPRALASIESVRRRLLEYAEAIDTKNWELLRSCFAQPCDAHYGELIMRSPDEVVATMRPAHEALDFSAHRITNMIVDVDGSRARSTSYLDALLVMRAHPDGPQLRVVGKYIDELGESGGTWRIATRRFVRLFSEGNERITRNDGRR